MLKPVLGSQLNLGSHLTRGLVGFWLMNEGSGNKVFDLVGGNTGTFVADTHFAPGKFGSALYFDGTDDQVNVTPAEDILAGVAGYSVGFWCKITATTSFQAIIGSAADEAGDKQFVIGTYETADPIKLTYRVYNSAGGANTFPSTTIALYALYVWHYVVLTWDGITARIYVNGILDGSAAIAGTAPTNPRPLHFGFGGEGAGQPNRFTGYLDNVMIHNRPLSAGEIAELYRTMFQI